MHINSFQQNCSSKKNGCQNSTTASNKSYGFWPKFSSEDTLTQCQKYKNDGKLIEGIIKAKTDGLVNLWIQDWFPIKRS